MKIQYKINNLLDKNDTLKVAGTLLKIMIKTLRASEEHAQQNFKPNDLVFYPMSAFEIGRGKKLILMASNKAKGILEYIDEKFMEEVNKENLQVQREVFP